MIKKLFSVLGLNRQKTDKVDKLQEERERLNRWHETLGIDIGGPKWRL